MTSEGMVRDTTEAERDAKVLREIRDWRERHPAVNEPAIDGDELDVLLRVAAERDALRRELCDSAESKGHHGDPRYVIRSCAKCGHAPHGVGLICWENNCPCRITGGTIS